VPENDPTEPLPEFNLDSATGNFVVQDLGDGHFALYAHLQLGSVRVRPGERIRRGQVLGLVGNTGNSSEPHLHFHVMDSPEPLLSDGLPYVFDDFRLQGQVDLSGAEPSILPTPGAELRQNRLPLAFDVLAFP
jgi:murein DD-endopeptidase MepM/ murein hydrolase activator NlpD